MSCTISSWFLVVRWKGVQKGHFLVALQSQQGTCDWRTTSQINHINVICQMKAALLYLWWPYSHKTVLNIDFGISSQRGKAQGFNEETCVCCSHMLFLGFVHQSFTRLDVLHVASFNCIIHFSFVFSISNGAVPRYLSWGDMNLWQRLRN